MNKFFTIIYKICVKHTSLFILGALFFEYLINVLGARFLKPCSKKAKLKTYGDMAKHLWNTFTKLASDYARIDINFDLYINYSIKETEWNRRNTVEGISTNIFGSERQLLIDTKTFRAVSEKKMKFQQFFIDWLTKNYSESIPLYLGRSHREITSCFKLSGGILKSSEM